MDRRQFIQWLFLLCFCRVAAATLGMTLIQRGPTSASTGGRTWRSKYQTSELKETDGALSYEELETVARLQYQWLVEQYPNPADRQTNKGYCLVAAFYDPTKRQVYSSTIPQGSQVSYMMQVPTRSTVFEPKRATSWWNQFAVVPYLARNNLNLQAKPPIAYFHAEDGAFFYWESENPLNNPTGSYPEGSMIAVWGKGPNDNDKENQGRRWTPCNRGGDSPRIPSCVDVSNGLRVSYIKVNGQLAQPANEGGGGPDSDEEQAAREALQEACGTGGSKLRRHGGKQRRDAAACSSLFSDPVMKVATPIATSGEDTSSYDLVTSFSSRPTTAGARGTTSSTNTAPFTCTTKWPDPDDGLPSQSCMCTQGSITSAVFAATGNNACPWTGFPLTGGTPVTATTSPKQTGKHDFITTSGLYVLECYSSSVTISDDVAITTCVPPVNTISIKPHVTVQLGSTTQSVGTLTGSALATAVSSALRAACPAPSSGQSGTSCTSTPTISGIHYTYSYTTDEFGYKGGGPLAATPTALADDGTLTVDPGDTWYTSEGIRDSLIELSSNTYGTWGSKCSETKNIYKRDLNGTIVERDVAERDANELLCGATKYAQAIYENQAINKLGSAGWINTAIEFAQGPQEILEELEGELLNCNTAGAVLGAMFDLIFPELSALELEGADAITDICTTAAELANAAQKNGGT